MKLAKKIVKESHVKTKNCGAPAIVLRPEVLIVGAGIAGCPLAVALRHQGLDVMLVERSASPRPSFKGEYLQPSAVESLKELGFGSVFELPSASVIQHLRFRDMNQEGQITSSITMSYPNGTFACSVEHFDMSMRFIEITLEHLGENFIQGMELIPIDQDSADFVQKPRFTAQHPELGQIRIEPKWVVGCDGRQSSVRRWMGGAGAVKNGRVVLGVKDEIMFGTKSAQISTKPNQFEVLRTKDRGTMSYFSLGQSGQRIYLSSSDPKKEELGQMNQNFREILKSVESQTGLTEFPDKLPLAGCPANTCWFGPSSKGAFILAGDALAVTTPYGGQGMSVALRHVDFLLKEFDWKTKSKIRQVSGLEEYDSFAVNTFERTNFLNFGLYYIFFSRPPFFKFTTGTILSAWEKNPELKNRVTRLFGGIDTDQATLTELLALGQSPLSRKAGEIANRNIHWA